MRLEGFPQATSWSQHREYSPGPEELPSNLLAPSGMPPRQDGAWEPGSAQKEVQTGGNEGQRLEKQIQLNPPVSKQVIYLHLLDRQDLVTKRLTNFRNAMSL